jgi:hypothetical protein
MGTQTPYPNGQVLVSSALTIAQINTLLQSLTCGMIGINPPDYSQVRIDWPTTGQPFGVLPSQDVCFLSCLLQDVDYNKIRNRTYSGTGPVTETWTYTRGWRIAWTLYGPNSTDRARQIWSATFMDYFNDQLNLSNLFPVPDPAEPVRAPELLNAEWWERCDFAITMYENVTETIEDGAVESVEVKVYESSPSLPAPAADVEVIA